MEYQLRAPINENYSVLQQILTNRGINYDDIEHYLNVSEQDNLSPLLLKNIQKAAAMLIEQLAREDSHIHIQVDSDCDGMTSSSLLLNYLHAIFPSSISKFSYSLHEDKIHGIDIDKIPAKTTLVIAPDSSSNEYEIHKQLHDNGIKVLVLDHHQVGKESEYACIVNNQLCNYPTKSLSGVGIVYKLCQYLDSILEENIADQFLDIVAVGLSNWANISFPVC